MTNTTCRRCSECVGEAHHWLENGRVCEPGDPYYVCKHCDAACAEVDDAQGFPAPSGVLLAQPPICDGCDFYVKDCECHGICDGRDTSSEECHECGAECVEACVCGAGDDPPPEWPYSGSGEPCIACGALLSAPEMVRSYEEGYVHANGCPERKAMPS